MSHVVELGFARPVRPTKLFRNATLFLFFPPNKTGCTKQTQHKHNLDDKLGNYSVHGESQQTPNREARMLSMYEDHQPFRGQCSTRRLEA